MDVVDKIERGEPPAHPTKILRASMATDGVPPPAPLPPAAAPTITADQLNNSTSN
jgi:peptidylprolyl isomerase